MLKAGIYVDVDNIMINGGWGMRYRVVREMVEQQNATVLRANAYMSIDEQREGAEKDVRNRRQLARLSVRREGFKLNLKPIKRYTNDEGNEVMKGNADMEMAVDAVIQSENLDYVLLVTGDGDFTRVAEALQNRGKRVDVLAFANISTQLREAADHFYNGFLLPGVVPPPKDDPGVKTGFLHNVNEEKGFGFMTMYTGLKPSEFRDDIFVHITDIKDEKGVTIANSYFSLLRKKSAVLEFDLVQTPDGKAVAKNVEELKF
jgi:uncharacterized LabA/DUF88 family protein/cold shock CspA family protein